MLIAERLGASSSQPGVAPLVHEGGEGESRPRIDRSAALDLLRTCAITLHEATQPRSGAVPVADTAKLLDRERAWAKGEVDGLMSIHDCVAALCEGRVQGAAKEAALRDIQQALLSHPLEVVEAIDGIRGDFLDHFQVHGAKALQAEMLSDALDSLALGIGWIQQGKAMSPQEAADLMLEIDWLSGREASFISARDCLMESLGLDAETAGVAQQRLLDLLPGAVTRASGVRDLQAIPAADVADTDVKLLASCALQLRRIMVESGGDVEVGDNVIGALRLSHPSPGQGSRMRMT